MRKAFLVTMLVAALGGCGKSNEKAFNDSFNTKFRESCVASASKSGVPGDIAGRICECAIAKIDQKFSVMEKLTVSDEKLNPIMTECVNSVVQK